MNIILTDLEALEALNLPPELYEPAKRVGTMLLARELSETDAEETFRLPSQEECERLAALDRRAFEQAMDEAGNWPRDPYWGTFAFMASVALRTYSKPTTPPDEVLRWKENAMSILAAFLDRFPKPPTP